MVSICLLALKRHACTRRCRDRGNFLLTTGLICESTDEGAREAKMTVATGYSVFVTIAAFGAVSMIIALGAVLVEGYASRRHKDPAL